MDDERKTILKKKLRCGWTLIIYKELINDDWYHGVEIVNTVGSTEHLIEIEDTRDMKDIGKAFLKAYERIKKS